jgi:NAD(P)-dependent dehydrogenase (short-subunit alcohol dehydrogenase family)
MNVNGMRCLLAGGARGLGAALALDLAERGADVAVSYHSSAGRAEETCAGVRALGRCCAVVQVDLADADDAHALVARAVAELGGLDALVYAASGPFVPHRPDEVDETAWAASLDTIAKGFFFTAQAAYRAFMTGSLDGAVGSAAGDRATRTRRGSRREPQRMAACPRCAELSGGAGSLRQRIAAARIL